MESCVTKGMRLLEAPPMPCSLMPYVPCRFVDANISCALCLVVALLIFEFLPNVFSFKSNDSTHNSAIPRRNIVLRSSDRYSGLLNFLIDKAKTSL